MREIALNAASPNKPKVGDPCNGCGVCCAMETCPVGRVLFMRKRGPCKALRWEGTQRRYTCGLVDAPGEYLRWLPAAWYRAAGRLVARSIAAGRGCDCDAAVS
jgi:hypothetical protein